jgi:hypothetical protein
MSIRQTYCLKLVTEFLDSNNLIYEFNSPKTAMFVETGILIKLLNDFSLSIQTHPLITSEGFSETCLIFKNKPVYTNNWYYFDVRRQYTPQELFDHIKELVASLENYEIIMHEEHEAVKLNNGEIISFTYNTL